MTMSGELDKATGKVKEVAGKATGDRKLEGRGKAQRVAGSAEDAAGHVRDAATEAKEKVTGRRGTSRR
jgi:uncharacterized protein YjbJ (UPF0337 family)